MYEAPPPLETSPHSKPAMSPAPIIENFEFFGEGEESQMVGSNENEDEVSGILYYFYMSNSPLKVSPISLYNILASFFYS